MLTRRQFLSRSLHGSSLIALGATVPRFLAQAAPTAAAEKNKDTILVVVEMNGGNDGLNTVVPFGDDLYHKARPTLGFKPEQLVRIDDYLGLHPKLIGLERLLKDGMLALVQGVGYPNPNRSHFESMDIWQTADPALQRRHGWLARGLNTMPEGQLPGIFIGSNNLPLALLGSTRTVASVQADKPFDLNLGGRPDHVGPQLFRPESAPRPHDPQQTPQAAEQRRESRRQMMQELANLAPPGDSMHAFVQRSALQTYSTIDRLREVLRDNRRDARFQIVDLDRPDGLLARDLNLVARMIQAGFGTRIYYVTLSGFDTHSNQAEHHDRLLREVANGISTFFNQLDAAKQAQRVLLMTYSEFGRRVQENGSRGTDHGAASCLFVAGPAVQGGVIGKHPSLAELSDGDLRQHTDFRRVYATLLEQWLGCPSREVLGAGFEPLPLLKIA